MGMNSDQLKAWLDAAPHGTTVPAATMQAAQAFSFYPHGWDYDADADRWVKD